MAKEFQGSQLSVKMKWAAWIIGLIFAAGVSYNTLDTHGQDIQENRGEIVRVKENVHSIQRGQDKLGSNIERIKDDVAEAKEQSKLKREEDREFQKEQRTINVKILTELSKWEAIKDGTP